MIDTLSSWKLNHIHIEVCVYKLAIVLSIYCYCYCGYIDMEVVLVKEEVQWFIIIMYPIHVELEIEYTKEILIHVEFDIFGDDEQYV